MSDEDNRSAYALHVCVAIRQKCDFVLSTQIQNFHYKNVGLQPDDFRKKVFLMKDSSGVEKAVQIIAVDCEYNKIKN